MIRQETPGFLSNSQKNNNQLPDFTKKYTLGPDFPNNEGFNIQDSLEERKRASSNISLIPKSQSHLSYNYEVSHRHESLKRFINKNDIL